MKIQFLGNYHLNLVVFGELDREALLGVLGIRDNWANYLRDKG